MRSSVVLMTALRQAISIRQTLKCSVCEQLMDGEAANAMDVIVTLFGARAFAVCPCCRQEVTRFRDRYYRRRARAWVADHGMRIAVFKHGGRAITTYPAVSLEDMRALHPRAVLQRMRVCKKCGHAECPCCQGAYPDGGNWCDVVDVEAEGAPLCCGGGPCVYDEAEPYPRVIPAGEVQS